MPSKARADLSHVQFEEIFLDHPGALPIYEQRDPALVFACKQSLTLLDALSLARQKERFVCVFSDGANPRRHRNPNISGHDTVLTGARCPVPKNNGVPARKRHLTFHVEDLSLTDFALDSCAVNFF